MPVYTDYEPIADDNQAAPPVGAPEGGYKGSVVNDTFRYMMAVIRNLGDGALQLDGTTSPTADIDWGNNRLSNLATSSNRTAAATTGQLQDNTFNWGGTTTGSGSAYTVTLTPLFTGSTYRNGQQIRAIFHTANTTTTPTFNAGTAGAKTMVHRNGSALRASDIQGGTRYTLEFDGTNWRVLDAGGYMEQRTYNVIYPVGITRLFGSTTDPNSDLPVGVSATWALEAIDSLYLRATTGAPLQGGGSLTTSGESGHVHGFSGTTDGNSAGTVVESGAPSGVAASPHTHTFSGTTGGSSGHTHTMLPPFVTYRLWRRTV